MPAIAYSSERPKIIFILGGPGVGKGTQCTRLATDFDVVHLSVGDLLRNQESPELASLIKNTMTAGGIVPLEIVMAAIQDAVDGHVRNGQNVFLMDGFPRNLEQLAAFQEQFGDCCTTLFFQGPEDVLLRRVLNRHKTSGRVDDNEITFRKRIQGYYDQTMPVIDKLREQGQVIEIDCTGDLDEGYDTVKQAFIEAVSR
ncbi:dCMP kinase [Aspergillus pseudotamarii]|uniref:dCMP kinase n=1 Tax=Aspergillus pseudotamarii TaxID=132259 RepID=A0A5N6SRW8_ASPPS|nr:dCMP kinase [Aspergillus pseudotamarii]KAE8136569.1 dCMP kinase [Aspergillus pseudotamarii]